MKPLAEGFRVYSRSLPVRELRPPKSSLVKAPGEAQTPGHDGPRAWISFAVFTGFGAFFVLVAVLS